jgi:hypothetical protein
MSLPPPSAVAGTPNTLTNADKQTTTVLILTCTAVIGKGSADGRGAKPWSTPVGGIGTHSTAWFYQTYRRHFGIETSYRQLHETHIKTSTRDPTLRGYSSVSP